MAGSQLRAIESPITATVRGAAALPHVQRAALLLDTVRHPSFVHSVTREAAPTLATSGCRAGQDRARRAARSCHRSAASAAGDGIVGLGDATGVGDTCAAEGGAGVGDACATEG